MDRRSSMFWPLALIAAGTLWILIQVGRIDPSNLWALAYLWPFLLIAAGIGLILRPYWSWATLVTSVLAVAALFLGVVFAGQFGWNHMPGNTVNGNWFIAGPMERGSGHVVTQSREVSDFSALRIAYPASIVIRQGQDESLSIEAEDNVVSAIRTQVVNHVLEIDSVPGRNLTVTPTRPVNITISVKDLSDLEFDSAGGLIVQGLQTDHFRAALDGAGSMEFKDLKLKSLEAILSGAGSFQASGAADTTNIRVDGVGSFDGAGLKTQSATVILNGLGGATIWAEGNLTATVNGLGSVSYYGNPQVNKSVNGLGSVQSKGAK